jgi:hypothetical protein
MRDIDPSGSHTSFSKRLREVHVLKSNRGTALLELQPFQENCPDFDRVVRFGPSHVLMMLCNVGPTIKTKQAQYGLRQKELASKSGNLGV